MNEETEVGCLKSSPSRREIFRQHVLSSLLVDFSHIPTDYKGLPQLGSCVLPFYSLNYPNPTLLSLTSRTIAMEDVASLKAPIRTSNDVDSDIYICPSPCEYFDRNPRNCCCDCKRRHPFFAISFSPAFGVNFTEVHKESTTDLPNKIADFQTLNTTSLNEVSALSNYKLTTEAAPTVHEILPCLNADLLKSFDTSKMTSEHKCKFSAAALKYKVRCPSHRKEFCAQKFTHLSVCPVQDKSLHHISPRIDRDTNDTPCAGGERDTWSSQSLSIPNTTLSVLHKNSLFMSQPVYNSIENLEKKRNVCEVLNACSTIESVFNYPLEIETNSESSSGAFPAFLFPSSTHSSLTQQIVQRDPKQQKEGEEMEKHDELHFSSRQGLSSFDTDCLKTESTIAALVDSFSVSTQSEEALSRTLSQCYSELQPQSQPQFQSQPLTLHSCMSSTSHVAAFAARPVSASSILPIVPSLVGRQYQRYDGNIRLVVGSIPYRILQIPTTLSLIPVHGVPVQFPVFCTRVQFLLVSSSRADEWIFPKGGWEVFESCEEGARRETLEESGAIGLDRTLHNTFQKPVRKLKYVVNKDEHGDLCEDKDKHNDDDKNKGMMRRHSVADHSVNQSSTQNASTLHAFQAKKGHPITSSLAYSCSVPFKSEKAEKAQKLSRDPATVTTVKAKSPKIVTPSSASSTSSTSSASSASSSPKVVGTNCLITFLLRTGTSFSQFAEDERERTWLSVEEVSTILRRPHMLTAFSYTLSKAQDEFILASKAEKETGKNDTFYALYEALQAESTWEALITLCESHKIAVSLKPQPIGDIGVDYLSSLVSSDDLDTSPFAKLYHSSNFCNEECEECERVEKMRDTEDHLCASSFNLRHFFGSNGTNLQLSFPEVYSQLVSELPSTLATSDDASLEADKLARKISLLAQQWAFKNENKGLHVACSQAQPSRSEYSLNVVKHILHAALEISPEITQDRILHTKQRRQQRKSPEAFVHSIQELTKASGGIKPRPDDSTLHLLSQTALKESKLLIPGRLKNQIE